MTQQLPFGAWPSPISATAVAAGAHPVDHARFVGEDVWWSERMPAEGGRTTLRRRRGDAESEPETLLPAPWDIRTRVHEYGGGAWTTVGDTAVFSDKTTQRVWAFRPGSDPVALTPKLHDTRYADLTPSTRGLLAVREVHREGAPAGETPHRAIVAIPLDGSAATDPAAVEVLASGSDFLGYPRLSPDGAQLAWIAWDHPAMPWDGTELRLVDLAGGGVRVLAGGPRESVLQPEWTGPDELTFVSDRTGRWNLESLQVATGDRRAISPADADTGGPLWNLAAQWYAPLEAGGFMALRTHGGSSVVRIDDAGVATAFDVDLVSRPQIADARGDAVLLVGVGSADLGGLWKVDARTGTAELIRSNVDESPDPAWLPTARALTVQGPHGAVHAYAYPPTNPDATAPAGETPPYIVLAHGGPTAHVSGGASLDVAFFTSRGIGVLDVNYGGSSGYGRAYRERLLGQWGIVDRDDVVAAADGAVAEGLADGERLAIKGGSAGGWTVLCALTASERFAAGISRYGVADLRALATDTHDFEARYLDGLVGPYPQDEQVYLDRSPLSHLDRFTTPMLIEQGLDDPVVPPAQSEAVRDALAARGVPHAYLSFEGESHGFRRAETIVACLEAELGFLGAVFGFTPAGMPVLELD